MTKRKTPRIRTVNMSALFPNATLVEALRQRNQLGAALRKLCDGCTRCGGPDPSPLGEAEKLLAEIWPDEALDDATAHQYAGRLDPWSSAVPAELIRGRTEPPRVTLSPDQAKRLGEAALRDVRCVRINDCVYDVVSREGNTFTLRLRHGDARAI